MKRRISKSEIMILESREHRRRRAFAMVCLFQARTNRLRAHKAVFPAEVKQYAAAWAQASRAHNEAWKAAGGRLP